MLINPIILADIGVAWLFIRYLIQRSPGEREPASGLWAAGVAGVIAVGLALFLEGRFVHDGQTPLTTALLVGIIEECAKLIPLTLWLYRKSYFNEVTDGIIYFGIAGMMFGLIENIGYGLTFGGLAGVARLITVPFLHAGFCVCFGWLLARRKVLKGSWLPVLLGLLAAIGLHTLYDFGLMHRTGASILMSLIVTAFVNWVVFYLYSRAERHDRSLGLTSSSRHNWYCLHCGSANPRRLLHCPACGLKT